MTTPLTIVAEWSFTVRFSGLSRIHWLLGRIRSRAGICCVLLIRGLTSLLVKIPMCQEILICQISSLLQVFYLLLINECFHMEGYTAFEFFNLNELTKLFKILLYFLRMTPAVKQLLLDPCKLYKCLTVIFLTISGFLTISFRVQLVATKNNIFDIFILL